jgi:hypothetical protein
MKLKIVFTVAIVGFFMTGCKSKKAINYNEMIVKEQRKLAQSMDEEAPELRNYFANYVYDSIVSVSSRMEARINAIVANINKTPVPDVSQGTNFKKATLQYFNYMKGVYTAYKNYGMQTSPDGREIEMQVIEKMTNGEDQVIADMQKAQQIFAKNNGFKIKPAKEKGGSLTANSPAQ